MDHLISADGLDQSDSLTSFNQSSLGYGTDNKDVINIIENGQPRKQFVIKQRNPDRSSDGLDDSNHFTTENHLNHVRIN